MNRMKEDGGTEGRTAAQARGVSVMSGMAVGFRAFCALTVDGDGLMGSRWIAALAGLALAMLPALSVMTLRRARPDEAADAALAWAVGKGGAALIGLVLFAVLTYDAAASMRLMTGTAKYVAMPERSRSLILIMTAIPAVLAAMMGPGAATGGAVMWRRLMAALIVVLAAAQATSFRAAWLTPVLGPGIMELARESLPAAGIFSLSAAGWLMIAEGEDKRGRTIPVSLIRSGLATVALVVLFGMLTPGIPGESAVRSVRLGRLLANDRAGLSLELPYVTLIFGGMLTMLVFELAAAACAVRLVLPNVRYVFCAAAAGGIALLIALSGLSEREAVSTVSGWYYPAAALPFCTAGISACVRKRMEGRKADKKGKRA